MEIISVCSTNTDSLHINVDLNCRLSFEIHNFTFCIAEKGKAENSKKWTTEDKYMYGFSPFH